ncbi:glutamine synthetase [Candidatus Bathyarchaeota archaeon]|nr:glutamine synthetase [Candidatus Bathyarchaeota archaeon]
MNDRTTLERAEKDNVKFVSLQFTDLLGVIKEVIIPVRQLRDALTDGVWFDGSSIEGFARIQESDLYLKPDGSTYSLVPWLTGNGKTARIMCDICRPDGTSFEGDPRFILKRVNQEAAEMGFRYDVGPEPEFYLFRRDGLGERFLLDRSGYFDLSSHEGYRLLEEITTALESFGISAEASHHEVGQGQYEIDFTYGPALNIADKLLALKYSVKKIAQAHNLQATFMPKPVMAAAGSGMHIHQSLFDTRAKRNAFYDGNDRYRLSEVAYSFIAGQMKYIKEICAILCPTVNSYKRLVSGFEAPVYVTWASMNRSALIRVPQWFRQRPSSARVELRCPDPTCNPYLAFAVMLKAGLEGIRSNLTPPEPVEENVYQFDDARLVEKNIEILPTSLQEALDHLRRSEVVRGVLGDHLFERYVAVKTKEWNEFKAYVTSWELDRYVDMY